MKYLFIHTQAYPEIGLGHLMRTNSFASFLIQNNIANVVFLLDNTKKEIAESILNKQSQIIYNLPIEKIKQLPDHDFNQSWHLIDGNNYSSEYIYSLSLTSRARIAIIDDLGERNFKRVNMMINPNIYANTEMYQYIVQEYCELKLGSDYVFLREQFQSVLSNPQTINTNQTEIFVSIGGSDPHNQSQRILKLIEKELNNQIKKNIAINLILGPLYPWIKDIQKLIPQLSYNINLYINESNIAPIMHRSKIAIIAAGTTFYETAALGLPSLILLTADNQKYMQKAIEQKQAAINISKYTDISDRQIANFIQLFFKDQTKYGRLKEINKKLVDGLGCQRIAQAMFTDN